MGSSLGAEYTIHLGRESPEARGDQSRGPTHFHSVDARVRDNPAMAFPEVRSDHSRGSTQDRGVGAGLMLSPQRESSDQRSALGGEALGMHALAQTVIAGKTVYLQGVKISPAQVVKFVDHKREQLRSGVFLLAQLDADIDENAMAIIENIPGRSSRDQVRGLKPGTWSTF